MEKNNNSLSKEKIAIEFQKYNDANAKVITFLTNAKDYLGLLKQKEVLSSSDLISSTESAAAAMFGKKDILVSTYDSIKLNIDSLLPDLIEVLDLLKLEEKETTELFKTLEIEDIQTIKNFEQRCINYNQKERAILNKIFTKAPGLEALENKLFGLKESLGEDLKAQFQESAKMFMKYFIDFYTLVETKQKESIFNAFVSTILYLEQYERRSRSLSQNWISSFIKACKSIPVPNTHNGVNIKEKKKNIKDGMIIFINNFSKANFAIGFKSLTILNSFKDKLEIGDNLKPTKPYSNANDEGKLDSAFKTMLLELFEGVKFEESKTIKDLVKEIIKEKTDIKNLFKTFNLLYSNFVTKIESDPKIQINPDKKLYELKIKTRLGVIMSIEDLIKDNGKEFLKLDDDTAAQLNESFQNIINDIKDKKKSFKVFFEYNSGVNEVFKEGEVKDDGDDEKLSKKIIDNIIDAFTNIVSKLDINEETIEIDSQVDYRDFIKDESFKNLINSLFGVDNKKGESKLFKKALSTFETKDSKTAEDISEIITIAENINVSNIKRFWELFSNIFGNSLEIKN